MKYKETCVKIQKYFDTIEGRKIKRDDNSEYAVQIWNRFFFYSFIKYSYNTKEKTENSIKFSELINLRILDELKIKRGERVAILGKN